MKGTKKPRTFVFMYVCGVCVSVYVYYIYEYVIGSVWHSWQGFSLPCCCILGCRAVDLHCCWHGIRGGLMTFLT